MSVHGVGTYDTDNVFARILRGEIPCKRVYEDEHALAFHDIAPRAPVHVLIIPKTQHISFADFAAGAPPETVAGFFAAIAKVANQLGLESSGYRILSNMGHNAHQEVPHFHVHLFGGRPLGPMLVER
jgi:diadenosine tetraphosphate (Ap4A) HIT family hydrolase